MGTCVWVCFWATRSMFSFYRRKSFKKSYMSNVMKCEVIVQTLRYISGADTRSFSDGAGTTLCRRNVWIDVDSIHRTACGTNSTWNSNQTKGALQIFIQNQNQRLDYLKFADAAWGFFFQIFSVHPSFISLCSNVSQGSVWELHKNITKLKRAWGINSKPACM